jgi:hypothetical protein
MEKNLDVIIAFIYTMRLIIVTTILLQHLLASNKEKNAIHDHLKSKSAM